MNESGWLASTDPARMLLWLRGGGPKDPPRKGLMNDRKLRLFACGCCRQVWDGVPCNKHETEGFVGHIYCNVRCPLTHARLGRTHDYHCICKPTDCSNCHGTGKVGGLTDQCNRNAVEVAERVADGYGRERGWYELLINARKEAKTKNGWIWCATCPDIAVGLRQTIHQERIPTLTIQAALLRDIVGNPFRPAKLPPGEFRKCSCSMYGRDGWVVGSKGSWEKCNRCNGTGRLSESCPWLLWNLGTIPALARQIYDAHDFDRMPLLADMLEDAGCDNEDILRHCRGEQQCPGRVGHEVANDLLHSCVLCNGTNWVPAGPHVKGCWVIDLLLGKE